MMAVVADARNIARAVAFDVEVTGIETLAARITVAVAEKVETIGVATEVCPGMLT